MKSVTAHHVADYYACKKPGDFLILPPNPRNRDLSTIHFLCPCGCGSLCGVAVREDGENRDGAWGWNKDVEKPTCTPSIKVMTGPTESCWHGYLTNGEFKACE